jgi:WXXGXW repeat (2 copies)
MRKNTMRLHRAVRFLVFGLLLLVIPAALSSPSSAQIGIGVSVRVGPPALPIYAQPICPGPGYLWTPGYWGWNDEGGYYWVPGTWVVAPIGMLWTPGYWGWGGGFYGWRPGYWGPHVGFYGGINYGFGYGGVGFFGGEWRGGAFFYNTAVMRVDTVRVTNVYVNRTVVVNNESHVAFNGGEGGIAARPTAAEESAAHEPHQAALSAQTQHAQAASQNHAMFASENHGAPAVAATARPGDFSGHGAVAAKAAGAPYHAPAISPKEARAPASAANHSSTSSSSGSNAASRPFTPPSKNANSSSEHASTSPTNQETGKAASQPKSTPPSESHAESAPKSSASKPQKQQKQPKQKHNNAPKEEHNRGR